MGLIQLQCSGAGRSQFNSSVNHGIRALLLLCIKIKFDHIIQVLIMYTK